MQALRLIPDKGLAQLLLWLIAKRMCTIRAFGTLRPCSRLRLRASDGRARQAPLRYPTGIAIKSGRSSVGPVIACDHGKKKNARFVR